jgi:hypothetical protein
MTSKNVLILGLSLFVVSLSGMEAELEEKENLLEYEHEKTENNSSRMTTQSSTDLCEKIKCAVGVTSMIIGSGIVICSVPLFFYLYRPQPGSRLCAVNISQYPPCGGRSATGVDQNQAAWANLIGNTHGKQTGDYTYLDGKKPWHQICTGFDGSKVEGLPKKCRTITKGKLVGMVSGQKNATNHECRQNATRDLMEYFNKTGTQYCEVDLKKAGFDTQLFLPWMLTVYLFDQNVTLPYVSEKRWASNNSYFGFGWGLRENCNGYATSNVDPSAQKSQQSTYKFDNSFKTLKRYNDLVYKNSKTKFGKTQKYR